MPTIYTPSSPDLATVMTVAAIRHFILVPCFTKAPVVAVPTDWDGTAGPNGDLPTIGADDIAVGIKADGRGIISDGSTQSVFGWAVKEYATPKQQAALADLVNFVDQTTVGNNQNAFDAATAILKGMLGVD